MNTKNIILAALVCFAAGATPPVHAMQQRIAGEEVLISYAITGKADELEQFFKFYATTGIEFDINQKLILSSVVVKGTSYQISYPLMFFACVNGHKNVIKLLLKYGASINDLKNPKHASPLHLACQAGHLDAVKALLEDDALINIDARDQEHVTPLYCACQDGFYEIAKCLILKGAYVDAKCPKNCRPLHVACNNGFLDIVTLLLEYNANVNEKNAADMTPLMYAEENGHNEIAQLLRSHGAQ